MGLDKHVVVATEGRGVTLGWASLEGNGWQGISQEGGEREFMKIEERGLRRRNAR